MNCNGFNNVKLTDRQVYHILFLSKVKGLQPYQIKELFPVSKVTIKNIVNGKSRKDCYLAFLDYKNREPEKVATLFK
jgi:hypothetical protein